MIIKTTKKLNLSSSEVWNVLGEGFGNVNWIKGVKSCKFEGDLKIGISILRSRNWELS